MDLDTVTPLEQLTVVVNYFGRRGSGPEYALAMARGLKACGCRVHALLSADIDNLDRWRQAGFDGILTVRLSDHYRGAVGALARFFGRDLRRIRRHFEPLGVDALYIPMVHPLSVAVERMFRRRGAATVFTMHDVRPHLGEVNLHYLPIRLSAAALARRASLVTLLTSKFVPYVADTYRRGRTDSILITPHGLFDSYSQLADGPAAQPAAEFNLLVFGRIVRYKGLDLMAEAYRRLTADAAMARRVSLRIVGSGDFGPYAPLYQGLPGVTVINRHIPDTEVAAHFRMPGTIVVLPYTEASQSGVVPIAMQEGAQLVVTDFDGLVEQTAGGTLALTCRPEPEALYQALRTAVADYSSERLRDMRQRARSHVGALDWAAIARTITDRLTQCVNLKNTKA